MQSWNDPIPLLTQIDSESTLLMKRPVRENLLTSIRPVAPPSLPRVERATETECTPQKFADGAPALEFF